MYPSNTLKDANATAHDILFCTAPIAMKRKDNWKKTRQMATNTTVQKVKYTKSMTFCTLNCIYANYGKFYKPNLHPHTL